MAFFFSSRRRHTRWPRDWSSDVCSSDLLAGPRSPFTVTMKKKRSDRGPARSAPAAAAPGSIRSDERRVGKERRFGLGANESKKSEARQVSCMRYGCAHDARHEASYVYLA